MDDFFEKFLFMQVVQLLDNFRNQCKVEMEEERSTFQEYQSWCEDELLALKQEIGGLKQKLADRTSCVEEQRATKVKLEAIVADIISQLEAKKNEVDKLIKDRKESRKFFLEAEKKFIDIGAKFKKAISMLKKKGTLTGSSFLAKKQNYEKGQVINGVVNKDALHLDVNKDTFLSALMAPLSTENGVTKGMRGDQEDLKSFFGGILEQNNGDSDSDSDNDQNDNQNTESTIMSFLQTNSQLNLGTDATDQSVVVENFIKMLTSMEDECKKKREQLIDEETQTQHNFELMKQAGMSEIRNFESIINSICIFYNSQFLKIVATGYRLYYVLGTDGSRY